MTRSRAILLLVLLSGCKNVELDWPGDGKTSTDSGTLDSDGTDDTDGSDDADGDDTDGDGSDDGVDDTGDTDDGDGGDGDDGGDDSSDPSEEVIDPITATVSGTVTVELYQVVDGYRVEVDTAEIDGFPYGAIFVGGYDDPDEDGTEVFRGTDTILTPSFGPNDFEMTVTMNGDGELKVYASLDENNNTVIESSEPLGVWPSVADVTDGAIITDVEITIVAEYDPEGGSDGGGSDGGGSGGGGSDGGSGGGCNLVVSGPATVGTRYTGRGLAMLANMDGSGPVHYDIFDVTGTGTSSGTGSYSMNDVCPSLGSMQLLGAIDSNENGLFDPDDTSGAYVTAPDTNGNPIYVDTADLTDYELQIPIVNSSTGEEEDNRIELVPFVVLSGTVRYDTGTFDDLDPGTSLYVTALKYRPNTSVSASAVISNSFDYVEYPWADLTGQTEVSYTLMVPGNADIYLWAYADTDLDGTLNEVGEPVASGGADMGYIATGSTNAVYDLVMGVP